MVIVGAKGLAKEVLEIFADLNSLSSLYFFDNISKDREELLFERFPILKNFDEVSHIFKETGSPSFVLGLGNPVLRRTLSDEFVRIGGELTSVISPKAHIGKFSVAISEGCCILPGAVITSGIAIGRGCLINPNVTISHDSRIGDFCELSPGANITGHCRVGDYSFIGSNAVLLPKVTIGINVIVGAGAVVTKDVPDNTVVSGVPAVVRKKLQPLLFRE